MAEMLMGFVKGKWKKNPISKAWERCRKSLSENYNNDFGNKKKKKGQIMAPNGCFSVYVGAERQRFVVKLEFANHPLFRTLLEEAEMEYGFGSDGPIWLPCTVDLFYKVLAEMDSGDEEIEIRNRRRSFTKGYASLVLLSPAHFLCYANNNSTGHGGEYRLMDSEMMKMNHFQY